MGKLRTESKKEAAITVPLGEGPRGYCTNHIDVSRLTEQQAAALFRIRAGLDGQGAKLANGKRVVSNSDVVRWLLESAI